MYGSVSIARRYHFCGIDAWGPEKFENLGSGCLFLHTNVCTLKNPRREGWIVLRFRPGSVGRPPPSMYYPVLPSSMVSTVLNFASTVLNFASTVFFFVKTVLNFASTKKSCKSCQRLNCIVRESNPGRPRCRRALYLKSCLHCKKRWRKTRLCFSSSKLC